MPKAFLTFLLLPLAAHAVSWQDYPAAGLQSDEYTYPYTSPYTVNYTTPKTELLYDFAERYASIPNFTNVDPSKWYDLDSYANIGDAAWGPNILISLGAPIAPSVPGADYGTVAWQQQRIVAVAQQFQLVVGNSLGTIYQHHHLPQFNPYATNPSWPAILGGNIPITWGTANGGVATAAAGIDCSDFSSLIYNLAFGYNLNTMVSVQADPATPIITPTGTMTPQVIAGPNMGNGHQLDPNDRAQYEAIISQLQVGDLLYIHTGGLPGTGSFSNQHVVMWLGTENITFYNEETGLTEAATIPLVISSHNDSPAIWDENGVLPAPGVQILPFAADSWFYTNYDHAQRIIGVPEPSTAGLVMLVGLAGGLVLLVRRQAGLKA